MMPGGHFYLDISQHLKYSVSEMEHTISFPSSPEELNFLFPISVSDTTTPSLGHHLWPLKGWGDY